MTGAGIYVASRASVPERAAMWRRLRAEGWPIVSTWIDEAGEGETGDFGELWARIAREVTRSAGLVFYAEPGDLPLKGALVEVGMALGAGLPVVAILPDVALEPRSMRPVGSWLAHPNVRLCAHSVATLDNVLGAMAEVRDAAANAASVAVPALRWERHGYAHVGHCGAEVIAVVERTPGTAFKPGFTPVWEWTVFPCAEDDHARGETDTPPAARAAADAAFAAWCERAGLVARGAP